MASHHPIPSTPENGGSDGSSGSARQVSPGFADAVEDAGGGRGGLGAAGPNSSSASSSAVAGDTAHGIGSVLKKGIFIQAGSAPAARTQSGYSRAQVDGFIQGAIEGEKAKHRVELATLSEAAMEVKQEAMQLKAAHRDLILRAQLLYILCFALFEIMVCSAVGLYVVSMVSYFLLFFYFVAVPGVAAVDMMTIILLMYLARLKFES